MRRQTALLLSYPQDAPCRAEFCCGDVGREMLRAEFSYIPPEIPRFENRFAGIRSGNCLMALLYTMQAMLGYGDDYEDLRDFQQIALRGFAALRGLHSLADITCFDPRAKRRYNCPYIGERLSAQCLHAGNAGLYARVAQRRQSEAAG